MKKSSLQMLADALCKMGSAYWATGATTKQHIPVAESGFGHVFKVLDEIGFRGLPQKTSPLEADQSNLTR